MLSKFNFLRETNNEDAAADATVKHAAISPISASPQIAAELPSPEPLARSASPFSKLAPKSISLTKIYLPT
jgi:hypothetical protein